MSLYLQKYLNQPVVVLKPHQNQQQASAETGKNDTFTDFYDLIHAYRKPTVYSILVAKPKMTSWLDRFLDAKVQTENQHAEAIKN